MAASLHSAARSLPLYPSAPACRGRGRGGGNAAETAGRPRRRRGGGGAAAGQGGRAALRSAALRAAAPTQPSAGRAEAGRQRRRLGTPPAAACASAPVPATTRSRSLLLSWWRWPRSRCCTMARRPAASGSGTYTRLGSRRRTCTARGWAYAGRSGGPTPAVPAKAPAAPPRSGAAVHPSTSSPIIKNKSSFQRGKHPPRPSSPRHPAPRAGWWRR